MCAHARTASVCGLLFEEIAAWLHQGRAKLTQAVSPSACTRIAHCSLGLHNVFVFCVFRWSARSLVARRRARASHGSSVKREKGAKRVRKRCASTDVWARRGCGVVGLLAGKLGCMEQTCCYGVIVCVGCIQGAQVKVSAMSLVVAIPQML